MGIAVPRTDQIQQPVSQFSPQQRYHHQIAYGRGQRIAQRDRQHDFWDRHADNDQPTAPASWPPNLWAAATQLTAGC